MADASTPQSGANYIRRAEWTGFSILLGDVAALQGPYQKKTRNQIVWKQNAGGGALMSLFDNQNRNRFSLLNKHSEKNDVASTLRTSPLLFLAQGEAQVVGAGLLNKKKRSLVKRSLTE